MSVIDKILGKIFRKGKKEKGIEKEIIKKGVEEGSRLGDFINLASKDVGWGRDKAYKKEQEKEVKEKLKIMEKMAKIKEKIAKKMEEAEAKESEKEKKKIKEKTVPWILKIFVAIILVVQAFYPKTITNLFWVVLIVLVVLIIALVLVTVYTHGIAGFFASNIINNVIVAVVIIFIILLLARIYPSPNYGEWLGTRYGTITSSITFLLLLAAAAVLIPNSSIGFFVGTFLFWVSLNFIGPVILHSLVPGNGFCIPEEIAKGKLLGSVPFIKNMICQKHIKNKETYISESKSVEVPVKGGVYVQWGYNGNIPELPSGSSYQIPFKIKNAYDTKIKIFGIEDASLYTRYKKGNVVFLATKCELNKSSCDKTITLNPNQEVWGRLLFGPDSDVETMTECPYTKDVLNEKSEYLYGKKSECALDSSCSNPSSVCIKTDRWMCECLNWTRATCSDSKMYAQIGIEHTGEFIGEDKLYYSNSLNENNIEFTKLTQGPLSLKVNFIPNPYIEKFYSGYIDKVQLVGSIEYNGKLYIDSMEIEPIKTTVTTIDRENNLEINETIGINKIDCKGIYGPNGLIYTVNKLNKKWSGVMCNFTTPEVNITIKNTRNGEIINATKIDLYQIKEYCNAKLEGIPYEVKNNIIENYGLCSLLNSTQIQNALMSTKVLIKIKYHVKTFHSSPTIQKYWTPICG